MDTNTIVERIKDVSLLRNDSQKDWRTLSFDYPYFSAAQWLKYGNDYFHQQGNLHLVSLYKSEPLEFVSFVHDLKFEKPTDNIVNSKESLENAQSELNQLNEIVKDVEFENHENSIYNTNLNDVELIDNGDKTDESAFAKILEGYNGYKSSVESEKQEDILELINELPNSNLFEINEVALPNNDTNILNDESYAEIIIGSNSAENVILDTEINDDEDKSLMVMMSFTDWLTHFKHKTEAEKTESLERKALKTAWQKEKLAEAADEELDEIPEPIFKQAMQSISMESTLISEALAEILAKQGKKDKAIAMYKKLSLRNPEKNTFFADRIQELNSDSE